MAFEHYLYHSFPRRAQQDPLAVMNSIVQHGLLMVLEELDFPTFEDRDFSTGATTTIRLYQVRACFTELPPPENEPHPNQYDHHAMTFGCCAIEFEVETVRQLGGLPVHYLPVQHAAGSADDVAMRMLKHLLAVKARLVCEALTTHTPRIGAQIQALQRLTDQYYPTDRGVTFDPLGYFRQREWRITTAMMPPEVFDAPTNEQRKLLESIDAAFFGRRFSGVPPVDGGPAVTGQPRSAHCRFMKTIRGAHVLSFARRIICPTAFRAKAERLLRDSSIGIPVSAYDPVLVP